jgi:DNA-binding NarL/FixJ family response regulator
MSVEHDRRVTIGTSGNPLAQAVQGPAVRVVVQQRQRLFREGISQLLDAEGDVDVVATATSDGEVLAACRHHHPSTALIEADVSDWDPLRLSGALRRLVPAVVVVGLRATPPSAEESARARRAGMQVVVSRDAGIRGILDAVRAPAGAAAPGWPTSFLPAASPAVLTSRELEILGLVAAGLTSNAASNRLQISHKTVENHKQRIFAKLGVQNQAHAVSVAMRSGLLRPERVVDLAAGG